MNEVKIEAGKVGRLSAGYHFTEKENEVLDRIEKLDFGAASIFEYYISVIIRKDKNWKENTKDLKELFDQFIILYSLDKNLFTDLILILE
jgi:hypothetical protein